MLEIYVDENIAGQRFDRFVRKFLDKGNLGFIYRMIRKGSIEVNKKKTDEKYILKENDIVRFWMSDETINKFRSTNEYAVNIKIDLDIVYEDKNIIAINKPSGMLSHSRGHKEGNVVDGMIQYLVATGEYAPKDNPTFVPGIVNRLDYNTTGIIIGCKNYTSLRKINQSIKTRNTKRYYTALVKGMTKEKDILQNYLTKTKNNTVIVSNDGDQEIITAYSKLKGNNKASLIEVDLITGRTHQIRAHMSYINHPILGDNKYGDRQINDYIEKRYGIKRQLLHCSKIVFKGLEGDLKYLNDFELTVDIPQDFKNIIKGEL